MSNKITYAKKNRAADPENPGIDEKVLADDMNMIKEKHNALDDAIVNSAKTLRITKADIDVDGVSYYNPALKNESFILNMTGVGLLREGIDYQILIDPRGIRLLGGLELGDDDFITISAQYVTPDPHLAQDVDYLVSQVRAEIAIILSNLGSISGGIGIAEPDTEPDVRIKTYNAFIAGTYTNFDGIVVSSGDLTSGIVQLWQDTEGDWNKSIKLIDLLPYVKKIQNEFGGWYTNTANANTAIPNSIIEGRSNREGKLVKIGTAGNYVTYWWKGPSYSDDELVIYTNPQIIEIQKKLPEVIPSKNLFNPSEVQDNRYQSSTVSSGISGATGWHCSGYIPVTDGSYSLSATSKPRQGVGYYNSSKVCVRYQSMNTGLVTVLAGEAFVVFNLDTDVLPGWTNVQFERSASATTYEPFGAKVKETAVEGLTTIKSNAQTALTNANAAQVTANANAVQVALNTTEITGIKSNLPSIVLGKNLFNTATKVDNSYQPSSVAGPQYALGWHRSDYIPVAPGIYYISATLKNRTGVGYYNSSKVCVRYQGTNTGQITVQSGEAYIIINLDTNVAIGWSNVQVERNPTPTTYEGYGTKIAETAVEGLSAIKATAEGAQTSANTAIGIANSAVATAAANTSITRGLTLTEILGTNLLNPENVVPGTLLEQGTGTVTTGGVSGNYTTWGLTRVEGSTAYFGILNGGSGTQVFRKLCYYDEAGLFISGVDGWLHEFTTPPTCRWIRVSVPNVTTGATYNPVNYGLFLATDADWEPYYSAYSMKLVKDSVLVQNKEDTAIASIKNVKEILASSSGSSKLGYLISGENILITYTDGDSQQLEVSANDGYARNSVVNFVAYDIAGESVALGDDVAPIHAMGFTLGANHGWTVYLATIAAHGKGNEVIGTAWVKGGINFYPLLIVDANTIMMVSQNSGTLNQPLFTALTPGVLVKDAENLTVTASVSTQLYPSINNHQRALFVDGVTPLTGGGSASFVDVIESYDILHLSSVIDNLIARAGTMDPPVFTGSSVVKIRNIYRLLPDKATLIIAAHKFNMSVRFTDIMVNQAVRIGINNVTQYYVPNSNPVSGLDFRKPLVMNWNSGQTTLFLSVSASPDPTNPPNRVIQYYNNLGFMLGYIKLKGVGKTLPAFTGRTFELRGNTGKVYPHPVESTVVGINTTDETTYNTVLVRAFTDLSVTRVGNRLSMFNFDFEGGYLIYLDYLDTMLDYITIPSSHFNGFTANIVESKNCTLLSEIYNEGLYVKANYVDGETCFIVLHLKKL